MEEFDPKKHIVANEFILDSTGNLPSFHDANVHLLNFWRGDIRPDDNVWIGPMIDACLELTTNEVPFVIDFRFHDCNRINMPNFNHGNMINDLLFSIEERGFFADNVTPLPPYICIDYTNGADSFLSFKCFKVEIVSIRPISGLRSA